MPTCKAQRHNRLTLISDESRHRDHHKRLIPRLNPPSTMGPSTRWTPNLHNSVGHTPTTQLGAPKHNSVGHTPTTQLGAPKQIHTPTTQTNRLGFKEPKSKKLLTFHSPNPRGERKPMQPMQWQEHKCLSASLPNSTKATKAMGE